MKPRRYCFGHVPAGPGKPVLDMSRINLRPSTAGILFDVPLWKDRMLKMGLGTLEGCLYHPNQGDSQRPTTGR